MILGVDHVCDRCYRTWSQGSKEFISFKKTVSENAIAIIKSQIKDGRVTLGNEWKGEII